MEHSQVTNTMLNTSHILTYLILTRTLWGRYDYPPFYWQSGRGKKRVSHLPEITQKFSGRAEIQTQAVSYNIFPGRVTKAAHLIPSSLIKILGPGKLGLDFQSGTRQQFPGRWALGTFNTVSTALLGSRNILGFHSKWAEYLKEVGRVIKSKHKLYVSQWHQNASQKSKASNTYKIKAWRKHSRN